MKIREIYNTEKKDEKICLDSLFLKQAEVIVLKDFYDKETIEYFLEINRAYKEKYKPSEGYTSLPRPFGGYLGEKFIEGYVDEINFLYANDKRIIIEQLKNKFLSYFNKELIFSDLSNNYSHSKSFFAIRELESGKGTFDIHCGNYFNDWNKSFFDFQNQFLKPRNHLSFLSVFQQNYSEPSIIIYDANWHTHSGRSDINHLLTSDNKNVNIKTLHKTEIKLEIGDLLIFNESHFWHQVPKFLGNVNRITLGGFVSEFKDDNSLLLWS